MNESSVSNEIRLTKHPDQQGYQLKTVVSLNTPLTSVFDFFSDATQLEAITPPWLHFHVMTPQPLNIREGTLIDYRLRLHGIPVRWRTRITVWAPPFRFVDEQLKGPYRWWRHEHIFEEVDGATRVTDIVNYGVPGGWLAHELLVRRDLMKIFSFRQQQMFKLLAEPEN